AVARPTRKTRALVRRVRWQRNLRPLARSGGRRFRQSTQWTSALLREPARTPGSAHAVEKWNRERHGGAAESTILIDDGLTRVRLVAIDAGAARSVRARDHLTAPLVLEARDERV